MGFPKFTKKESFKYCQGNRKKTLFNGALDQLITNPAIAGKKLCMIKIAVCNLSVTQTSQKLLS